MSEFSNLFTTANRTYIPSFDTLPESPGTPGFEGGVRQVYERVVHELADMVVLLTEVFDDLGRVVARSYTYLWEYPPLESVRLESAVAAVDSDWGMVGFRRPNAPINRYSRVNPQRMKLDPVILAATAAACKPRPRGDEEFRVSKATFEAIVAGPSWSVPDERRTE